MQTITFLTDLGLGNTASIIITYIVASVLSLLCGLAIGICSTWCCMKNRGRRDMHEESRVVRPVIYNDTCRNCERRSRRREFELVVDRNRGYGPLIRSS